MPDRISALLRVRWLFAAVLSALVVVWPNAAIAHTDFVSSDPANEAVVDGPLTQVTIDFTNPAEPAGDGFVLLEPSGETREPSAVDPTDGTSFVLTFDPPLTAGTYGVRWQVRAGDAHPIDGAFSFEVVGPTVETTAPSVPAETVAPAETVPAADAGVAPAPPTTLSASEFDALLTGDSTGDDAAWVGRVGRTFTFLGLIFGVGAVAALVWVIRGRRDEIFAELNWIRLAGLGIAVGGFVEWAGLHMTHDPIATELLDTKAGIAVALKIVGGLAVLVGFHPRAGRIVMPERSLSAATLTEPDAVGAPARPGSARWTVAPSAVPGLIGFALVVASFWFDGHTVSRGNWAIHATANLVHLLAASVWAGGVFAMATVVWLRRRAAEPTDTAAMVVRFSSIAAVSLAAVALAGSAMAFMILDGIGDLFDTEWGRALLVKTAAVAIAAGIGGYNHLRLRPALDQRPGDDALLGELRRTLTIESIVFVVVILLTSWLVAAAV